MPKILKVETTTYISISPDITTTKNEPHVSLKGYRQNNHRMEV